MASMARSRFESCSSVYSACFEDALSTRSVSSDAPSNLGLLRCCFRPNTEANDSARSRSTRPFLTPPEESRPIGSLCRLSSTAYGSLVVFSTCSRKSCSSCCPTTRVFPNHLRSGCTRAACIFLTVSPTASPPFTIFPVLFRFTLVRYMLIRLMVAFDLTFGPPALALAVGTRSGLLDALPCRLAPLTFPALFVRNDLGIAPRQRARRGS
mmetsp:Transcript_7579/g.16649  ORF Transcript_7579/g.16649 Transcript_7579/m.16649 type:complete len:210 (+) Transcript_7579:1034-1663(+)